MSWSLEDNEVQICGCHPERPTQMIWTFAFPGWEYWCPACGAGGGMFGTGEDVKWTWAIHHRYLKDLKRTKRYLQAMGSFGCSSLKYHGEWITPKEMPEKLRNYYKGIINRFKYIK
jgi:hypothetical protein